MLHDVFALHTIGDPLTPTFPFPVADYQRYIFGDDALAYHFGTALAKAFISPSRDLDAIAVAVLSTGTPTAPHALRDHFVAHLNRHVIAANAHPVRKLELFKSTTTTTASPAYHVDTVRLENRPLLVVSDFRLAHAQESEITSSLRDQGITSAVSFVYLLALHQSTPPADLSAVLSSVVNPSIETITSLSQAPSFRLNEAFVRVVMGREHGEFCRVVRRLEDGVARGFLECAIAGGWYDEEGVRRNFSFLVWEVEMREGIA